MPQSTPAKSARLSLRLDAATKQKIERAASFSHRSISSFVLASALETAEEVIRKQETLLLSDRDRDRFFALVLNPPLPNQALRDAFAAHLERVAVDEPA